MLHAASQPFPTARSRITGFSLKAGPLTKVGVSKRSPPGKLDSLLDRPLTRVGVGKRSPPGRHASRVLARQVFAWTSAVLLLINMTIITTITTITINVTIATTN